MKVLREASAFFRMPGDKSVVLLVFPAKAGNTSQSLKWLSRYIVTSYTATQLHSYTSVTGH